MKKISILGFLRNNFSFDSNVDLTDPTNILYRKNYCIRNIISVCNIVFFIFSLVGISNSNLIITIMFWLLLTALSLTIRVMIKNKKDEYHHQSTIMYLQSIFVFLMSVVLYLKTYFGFTLLDQTNKDLSSSEFAITQTVYVLMLLTMVIVSLYQDQKLLFLMFLWSSVILLVINITTIHPELLNEASGSVEHFVKYIFEEEKNIGIDIILRMLLFAALYGALASSASVTKFISEERRQEHRKRVDVEVNFNDVVRSVLDAIDAYSSDISQEELEHNALKVRAVALEICNSLNLDQSKRRQIFSYSTVHADNIYTLKDKVNQNDDIDTGVENTRLATQIIKRLRITRKADDIVYRNICGTLDSDFIESVKREFRSVDEIIILLSEIYYRLRNEETYKRALTHERSTELIDGEISKIFTNDLIVRFIKFNEEINEAYDKA